MHRSVPYSSGPLYVTCRLSRLVTFTTQLPVQSLWEVMNQLRCVNANIIILVNVLHVQKNDFYNAGDHYISFPRNISL